MDPNANIANTETQEWALTPRALTCVDLMLRGAHSADELIREHDFPFAVVHDAVRWIEAHPKATGAPDRTFRIVVVDRLGQEITDALGLPLHYANGEPVNLSAVPSGLLGDVLSQVADHGHEWGDGSTQPDRWRDNLDALLQAANMTTCVAFETPDGWRVTARAYGQNWACIPEPDLHEILCALEDACDEPIYREDDHGRLVRATERIRRAYNESKGTS